MALLFLLLPRLFFLLLVLFGDDDLEGLKTASAASFAARVETSISLSKATLLADIRLSKVRSNTLLMSVNALPAVGGL